MPAAPDAAGFSGFRSFAISLLTPIATSTITHVATASADTTPPFVRCIAPFRAELVVLDTEDTSLFVYALWHCGSRSSSSLTTSIATGTITRVHAVTSNTTSPFARSVAPAAAVMLYALCNCRCCCGGGASIAISTITGVADMAHITAGNTTSPFASSVTPVVAVTRIFGLA